MSEHSLRARKWPKRLAIAMLAAIIAAAVGFFAYTSDCYRPGEIATGLSEELAASGDLRETNVGITLGEADAEVGIVLYPGAKVDPHAYVPLAQELASKGYYCVIAKMPFKLAFFGIDAASGLMEAAPGVHEWWIAGHSLGGCHGGSVRVNARRRAGGRAPSGRIRRDRPFGKRPYRGNRVRQQRRRAQPRRARAISESTCLPDRAQTSSKAATMPASETTALRTAMERTLSEPARNGRRRPPSSCKP